jgi:integrase
MTRRTRHALTPRTKVIASHWRGATHGRHLAGRDEAVPYVFPSAASTRQDRNRVRNRVLARAVKKANERLAKDALGSLPEPLTLHALRRTFASVLVALCHDPRYVMDQIGHSNRWSHSASTRR